MEVKIRWQRPEDRLGPPCERCVRTGREIASAAAKLREALRPLGVEIPPLEISEAAYGPLESNRIWINDRAAEEWLHADAGRTKCRCAAGAHDCRVLYVNGRRYEILTEELLVKAVLLAAASLLAPTHPACRRRRIYDLSRAAELI
jgi:hypothetical protein